MAFSFTVADLILEADVMAGIAAAGDPLQPNEAVYGWRKCNDLIQLLQINRLMMFRRQRTGPFIVTAGMGNIDINSGPVTPITIGVGATWNTPRPVWIDYAGLIYTAGNTPPPELPMRAFTVKEWREIIVKGITATISRALIYDQTFGSSGFGNIYLYPVPSASFQVVLYTPQAIDEFPVDGNGNPDYMVQISLPPGYRPMLISNLAKIISIGVLPVSQDLKDEATNTLAAVKSSNLVQHFDALQCDTATLGRDERATGWDWVGGGFT